MTSESSMTWMKLKNGENLWRYSTKDPTVIEMQIKHAKSTFFDAAMLHLVDVSTWVVMPSHGNDYVVGHHRKTSVGCKLHRVLLGLQKGDGVLVDHKDGDGLNNTSSNLRRTDSSGNTSNARLRKDSTTEVTGVYDNKKKQCIYVYVSKMKKRKYWYFSYGKKRTYEEAFELAVAKRKLEAEAVGNTNGKRPKRE